jgi:hypothetical protein
MIIAINVELTDNKTDLRSFDFFVNVRTFLKSSFPSSLQSPIPWEAWGPQNTRWFPGDDGHSLHGQRAVDTVTGVGNKRRLRVRDFNPSAVWRSAQGQMEKGWKCRAVTTPSTMLTEGAYEKDVVSSLPYTEVVSEETFRTDTVLMDGSRLLLFEVSERWASFTVQVLTMLRNCCIGIKKRGY